VEEIVRARVVKAAGIAKGKAEETAKAVRVEEIVRARVVKAAGIAKDKAEETAKGRAVTAVKAAGGAAAGLGVEIIAIGAAAGGIIRRPLLR
jgi:hypothetical protein